MKKSKKKIVVPIASGLAAAGIGTGLFAAFINMNTNLYGCPPDPSYTVTDEEGTTEEATSGAEIVFNPEDNIPVDVYGPPEYFFPDETEKYSPEDNTPVAVYGPPEWFTDENAETPEPDVESASDTAASAAGD